MLHPAGLGNFEELGLGCCIGHPTVHRATHSPAPCKPPPNAGFPSPHLTTRGWLAAGPLCSLAPTISIQKSIQGRVLLQVRQLFPSPGRSRLGSNLLSEGNHVSCQSGSGHRDGYSWEGSSSGNFQGPLTLFSSRSVSRAAARDGPRVLHSRFRRRSNRNQSRSSRTPMDDAPRLDPSLSGGGCGCRCIGGSR